MLIIFVVILAPAIRLPGLLTVFMLWSFSMAVHFVLFSSVCIVLFEPDSGDKGEISRE